MSVFNILPGQGLGFSAGKEIALGLGTPFGIIEAVVKRVKSGGRFFKEQAIHYTRLIKEDKEILDVIIQSFIAGLFND